MYSLKQIFLDLYQSGLLHWHRGNLTIATVPVKYTWLIWVNMSLESIRNSYFDNNKQNTTKRCSAYFVWFTAQDQIFNFAHRQNNVHSNPSSDRCRRCLSINKGLKVIEVRLYLHGTRKITAIYLHDNGTEGWRWMRSHQYTLMPYLMNTFETWLLGYMASKWDAVIKTLCIVCQTC